MLLPASMYISYSFTLQTKFPYWGLLILITERESVWVKLPHCKLYGADFPLISFLLSQKLFVRKR